MARTFEHLEGWKEAVHFATKIYSTTKTFPKDELFGITSQLRRAAVSVSANIAEGAGRGSKKDFSRFVDIAIGSLNEVESLLAVSFELEYLNKEVQYEHIEQIRRLGDLLGGLKRYLNR